MLTNAATYRILTIAVWNRAYMSNASRPSQAQNVTCIPVQNIQQELAGNVRFGSLAALQDSTTLTAAFWSKADLDLPGKSLKSGSAFGQEQSLARSGGGLLCVATPKQYTQRYYPNEKQ